MPKMNREWWILIAMSVGCGTSSFAGDLSTLTIRSIEKDSTPYKATLQWNLKSSLCQIATPSHKTPLNIPFAECKGIDQFIHENSKELKRFDQMKFTIERRKKLQGPHLPLAELEVDGMKFAILKTAEMNCDADEKNCTPSSKLVIDQLGFKVLAILRAHQ
jgi:hypothetical protein